MDLAFNTKMDGYYQKFFDLQERLRKSEEERLKLEVRFNELVQISKEEEQAHYKKLRAQYKKFLEEDRKRQERNEKIIRTLERIESRVNVLTSKTERIKLLRRQYQSYLQRVIEKPIERREYIPPKITVSSEQKPPFDYNKKSCDIAMLKKAYGKTNEEKIEILDKYLQNLKSQKDQTPIENKPKDFDEIKYFDEVSKKLNEGFNSNEANSIAEEIMNSIYARHYKTDLFKDETEKISKFTVPHNTVSFTDKNRSSETDELNHNGTGHTFSFDGKPYMNAGKAMTTNCPNKLYESPYDLSQNLRYFADVGREGQLDLKTLQKSVQDALQSPSKAEIDLKENEKLSITTPLNISMKNAEPEYNHADNLSGYADSNISGILSDEIHTVENGIPLEDSANQNLSQQQFIEVIKPYNDANALTNNENLESEGFEFKEDTNVVLDSGTLQIGFEEKLENEEENNSVPVNCNAESIQQHETVLDVQEVIEPFDNSKDENEDPVQYEKDEQGMQVDESEKQVYEENNLQPQYEGIDQIYSESIQPCEETNQYDTDEQPIEQLYGENGKALEQYDENGLLHQQSYENTVKEIQQENDSENYNENNKPSLEDEGNGQPIENYDENSQPIQHFEESNQLVQQYDENGQLIQQYNHDGQPAEQYEQTGETIQHFDENGEAVQQFDENNQPIQQYDENNQPIHQYDNNGQFIPHYDENGQPVQQYDENGQPLLQYDENGQLISGYDSTGRPIVQYDSSGQAVQQYDENGQPIYFDQGEDLVQYDENGQVIQQYDENGLPISHIDPYQQYDNTGQQLDENGQATQQYEANQYGEGDQQLATDLPEQQENAEGESTQADNNEPKKKNVLDLLDTDSESVKQNTSKISNDSDFDFSNG